MFGLYFNYWEYIDLIYSVYKNDDHGRAYLNCFLYDPWAYGWTSAVVHYASDKSRQER